MASYNYVSLNSGTMCQLLVCDCVPAWTVMNDEFFVREDLSRKSIKTILNSEPLKGKLHQGFPELNLLGVDAEPELISNLKELCNLSFRIYVGFLQGSYMFTNARILNQGALSSYIDPVDHFCNDQRRNFKLTYNLPPGYYIIYKGQCGMISSANHMFQVNHSLPPYKMYNGDVGRYMYRVDDFYEIQTQLEDFVEEVIEEKFDRLFFISKNKACAIGYDWEVSFILDFIIDGDGKVKVLSWSKQRLLPLPTPDLADFCPGLDDDEMEYEVEEQALTDDGADPTPVPSNDPTPPKREASANENVTPANAVELSHETEGGDQGIDSSQMYGPLSARNTSSVCVPEGQVDAVHLAVDTIMDIEKPDFALNQELPSMANCWHKLEATMDANGNYIYDPIFNLRTRYVMNMFQYYWTRCVFRIVAKPPLFQSQQFWVGFNPKIKGVASTFSSANNLVGFNWTPSKENEKYVVTPWSSLDFMTSVSDFNQLGQLVISPRSELVSADSLPTPLELNVFVCPLDMRLYSPKPIDSLDNIIPNPDIVQYVMSINVDSHVYKVISGTEDIIVYVSDFEGETLTGSSTISVTSNSTTKDILRTADGLVDSATIINGNGTLDADILPGHTGSLFLVSSAEFSAGSDSSIVSPREDEVLTSITVTTADRAVSGFTEAFFLPKAPASSGQQQLVANGDIVYSTNTIVESKNFDLYVKAYSSKEDVLFEPATGTSYAVDIYSAELVTVTAPSASNVFEVVEQGMFDYKMDHEFSDNKKFYGDSRDHTTRLDNQMGLVGEYQLDSTDTQLVVDFLNPSDEFPYFDKERHLMFSKYPKLHFNVATIPSNNVKVRLTQTNSETPIPLNSIWQLPGHEWDLSSRTHSLSPYWNSPFPAAYSDKVAPLNKQYIQIDVIAGTIDQTPNIAVFYDVQDLEYHYQLGPIGSDIAAPTSDIDEVRTFRVTEQAETDSSPKTTSPVAGGKSEGATVQSEQRWNYVDSLLIPQDVSLVNIPINSRLFGPWTSKHLARYARWRGELKIKIVITNSQLVNGNFHAIHSNLELPADFVVDTSKMRDIIGDIDHSNQGAFGEALVLSLGWRTIKKYAPMDFSSNSADNGVLTIAIPTISTAPTATAIPSQLTIYTDCSGITASLPRSTTFTGGYQAIEPSTYARS